MTLVRARPRAFAVGFRDVLTWNVASQFAVDWNWPSEIVRPLGQALTRQIEPALNAATPESSVTLLTIRFDGSIEPRDPILINEIKGNLFRVHPGNVVFSKIDVRNGAIGLAPDNIENMCVTSEFPVYSVDSKQILPGYVKLLFRTDAFRKLLNSMISGASGRKRIQPSQLEEVKVPIPPLSAQHEIVSYWEVGQRKRALAERSLADLIDELNRHLVSETHSFHGTTDSRVIVANYAKTQQWDLKAGRAAAFISANQNFLKLGDYIEECSETVRPWEGPEKEWPIYGVNNKSGIFLNTRQKGHKFNAPNKIIRKDWFFHNPTRANVGSLGIVPDVPENALTSPEYQVWRLIGGFLPSFMALLIRTTYFLRLVAFNRVGGVKQRMYYSNLAEIRLPVLDDKLQNDFALRRQGILADIDHANETLMERKGEIEQMILGTHSVEV